MPRHAALARRNQRHGRRLLPGAEAACTDPVARVDTIVTALLSHEARPARGRRRRDVHKLREQGPDHVAPGSLPQVGLQRRRLRGRAGGCGERVGARAAAWVRRQRRGG